MEPNKKELELRTIEVEEMSEGQLAGVQGGAEITVSGTIKSGPLSGTITVKSSVNIVSSVLYAADWWGDKISYAWEWWTTW